MTRIFKEPSPFKTSLYSEINVCKQAFYNEYHNDFLREANRIKDEFPYLNINYYPYLNCNRTISLSGILIPKYIINELLITSVDEATKYGLKVFIIVPFTFRRDGVRVFDYNNVIDYDSIPFKFKHFRRSPNNNIVLCTHHKDNIEPVDPVLSVLYSAWTLFLEYKKLERIGVFNLNCLSHDFKGSSYVF